MQHPPKIEFQKYSFRYSTIAVVLAILVISYFYFDAQYNSKAVTEEEINRVVALGVDGKAEARELMKRSEEAASIRNNGLTFLGVEAVIGLAAVVIVWRNTKEFLI
jgi:hypothetical protein